MIIIDKLAVFRLELCEGFPFISLFVMLLHACEKQECGCIYMNMYV